jgi:hypothetical protein
MFVSTSIMNLICVCKDACETSVVLLFIVVRSQRYYPHAYTSKMAFWGPCSLLDVYNFSWNNWPHLVPVGTQSLCHFYLHKIYHWKEGMWMSTSMWIGVVSQLLIFAPTIMISFNGTLVNRDIYQNWSRCPYVLWLYFVVSVCSAIFHYFWILNEIYVWNVQKLLAKFQNYFVTVIFVVFLCCIVFFIFLTIGVVL